jgi:hypothetical protein
VIDTPGPDERIDQHIQNFDISASPESKRLRQQCYAEAEEEQLRAAARMAAVQRAQDEADEQSARECVGEEEREGMMRAAAAKTSNSGSSDPLAEILCVMKARDQQVLDKLETTSAGLLATMQVIVRQEIALVAAKVGQLQEAQFCTDSRLLDLEAALTRLRESRSRGLGSPGTQSTTSAGKSAAPSLANSGRSNGGAAPCPDCVCACRSW